MRTRLAVRVVLAAAFLVAGCGGRAPAASRTPAPVPPSLPTAGPAAAAARDAIEQALGQRQLQVQSPQVPYRPAEAPLMATAPRGVLQAVLPGDPTHGYVVVYELPNEEAASAAAEAQAAYVASAVGRVQFPFGTQFVVRRLGRAVIFYADPPDSPDDQAPDVVEALRTVGVEVPVPS